MKKIMQNYQFFGSLSRNFKHRTVYVHSVVQIDGSVEIVSRNEMLDSVPLFMSRFWDRLPSLYESWGFPTNSSSGAFDCFIRGNKRKHVASSEIVDLRRKIRNTQSLGDISLGDGDCEVIANHIEDYLHISGDEV